MGLFSWFKSTSLYKSIYRNEYPDTPRNQVLVILNSVVLHLHPVKLPRRAVRVNYTWGLGGLTLLFFLILTLTGVWLMFYYVPAVPHGYESMKLLETNVIFGMFARNMHRWGAHGMVIAVWLHMTRVFYTGAYKPPREFNWVIGVVLFLITVLLSFTGYLLPWDQLAFWAITVGSNMAKVSPAVGTYVQMALLGGYDIGPATLIRWYTAHVILLPLAAIALMAMHFWRIRKDGGISTEIPYDDEPKNETVQAPAAQ